MLDISAELSKPLTIVLLTVALISIPAYGHEAAYPHFHPPSHGFNFGWNLKIAIEDTLDWMSDNNPLSTTTDRLEAKFTSAIESGNTCEEGLASNKGCPVEIFERIESKLEQAKAVVGSARTNLLDNIEKYREANEIRKIVAEFQAGRYDVNDLQNRVNKLEIVDDYCPNGVNVRELDKDPKNAYSVLQDMCPNLKSYSATSAAKWLDN